jgi:hypothetical protein
MGKAMRSSTISEKNAEQLINTIKTLIDRIHSSSTQISQNLDEFQSIFGKTLQTHFVERAVAEMLQEPFSRLQESVQKNLDVTDTAFSQLSNWFSFYFGVPLQAAEETKVGIPKAKNATMRDSL